MLYIGEYVSGGRSRIGQAFEYSLDYQHVVRSLGNRDIRHFRPILPHAVLPPLSERILRLTILLVSRDCQSRNPVSKVFEAFLYASVRNMDSMLLFCVSRKIFNVQRMKAAINLKRILKFDNYRVIRALFKELIKRTFLSTLRHSRDIIIVSLEQSLTQKKFALAKNPLIYLQDLREQYFY